MALPLIPANQPQNPEISLKDALGMFQNSMSQLALSRAFSNANSKIKDLQQTEMKEQDRINAMNEVARELSFNMLRSGANAAQVDQATKGVRQPGFGSGHDVIMRGVLAGDEELTQKGVRIEELANQDKLALLQERAKGKGGLKDLGTEEIKALDGMREAKQRLTEITERVSKDKSLTGPMANFPLRRQFSADYATFRQVYEQYFNAYKKLITGVAAGIPEIKMLREALPDPSSPPEVFLAGVKLSLERTDAAEKAYLKILQKSNRDVSRFMSPDEQQAVVDKQAASGPDYLQYMR